MGLKYRECACGKPTYTMNDTYTCAMCEMDKIDNTCNIKELVEWLVHKADNADASANLQAPGSDEAIRDRIEAMRFRQCADLIVAAVKHG